MKTISKTKRLIVWNKYNGHCAYCGINIPLNNFHVDHVIALRRGDSYGGVVVKGTNHIDNLKPSCPSCNIIKSTFTVEEFRTQIGLKFDRMIRDSSNFRLLNRYGIIKKSKNDIIFYFEKH